MCLSQVRSRSTTFTTSKGRLIAEANASGATQREYIWLDDLPVAVVDDVAGTPHLLTVHADHLGRPVKMTDVSRATVWDATYLPFGGVHEITGSATLNARFSGQWFQLESDLAYNWHRHYDPSTGRYLEPDPLGFADGPNLYAYAGSNPVMWIDPTGEQTARPAIPLPPIAIPGSPENRGWTDWCLKGFDAIIGGIQKWARRASDDPDCKEEWEHARQRCLQEMARPVRLRIRTGPHDDMQRCMEGYVSERCGGKPVDR